MGLISIKRKYDSSSDDECTDDGRAVAKRSTAAKGPRSRKKTTAQRRQVLEADEWCLVVERHQVRCRGCNKWIMLRKNRAYEARNWDIHKGTCPQITGVSTKRRLVSKKPWEPVSDYDVLSKSVADLRHDQPQGIPLISTFFGQASSVSEFKLSQPATSESTKYGQHPGKYVTHTIKVVSLCQHLFSMGQLTFVTYRLRQLPIYFPPAKNALPPRYQLHFPAHTSVVHDTKTADICYL
jgi:hypothetical protein